MITLIPYMKQIPKLTQKEIDTLNSPTHFEVEFLFIFIFLQSLFIYL